MAVTGLFTSFRKNSGDSLSGVILSGAGFAFLSQVFGYGLGYINNVLYARWLGETEFGIFTYVSTWTLVLASVAGLDFPTVSLRFIPQYQSAGHWNRLKGLLIASRRLVLAAGFGLGVLGSLAGLWLCSGNAAPYRSSVIIGVWLIPIWAVIYLQTAQARAFNRIAIAYAPPRMMKPVLLVLTAYAFLIAGGRLTSATLLAASIAVLLAVLFLQRLCLKRIFPESVKRAQPEFRTREWLQVATSILSVTIIFTVLYQIDTLIIGLLMAPENIGHYGAALKTTQLMNMPAMAMAALAVPMFSGLHAEGKLPELQRLVSRVTHWSFWPALAGAGVIIGLSDLFLGLFGPGFISAKPAVIILVSGMLLNTAGGPVLLLLQVTGQQRQVAVVIAYSALLGTILTFIGVRTMGITGAAWANLFTSLFWICRLNMISLKALGIRSHIFKWNK